jgi:hypothetical protein
MTWGRLGLVVTAVGVLIWAGAAHVSKGILARAIEEGRPLTPVEELVVGGNLRLARAAPFAVIAFMVAPAVVGLLWSFRVLRPTRLRRLGAERRALGEWLTWSLVGIALGVVCFWAHDARYNVPTPYLLLATVLGGLGSAGAVHAAFRVQAKRVAMGTSAIDLGWVHILGAAVLGLVVPLWVYWRAGGDLESAAQTRSSR